MPTEPLTCYEKRRAKTEARLRAALERLRQAGQTSITVAVLIREAGISRAVIYKNHRPILAELNRPPRRDPNAAPRPPKTPAALEIADLKAKVRGLSGQNAQLLRRAIDAEQQVERLSRRIAELLRTMNGAKGVSVLHSVET
jgi:hypothetical protein